MVALPAGLGGDRAGLHRGIAGAAVCRAPQHPPPAVDGRGTESRPCRTAPGAPGRPCLHLVRGRGCRTAPLVAAGARDLRRADRCLAGRRFLCARAPRRCRAPAAGLRPGLRRWRGARPGVPPGAARWRGALGRRARAAGGGGRQRAAHDRCADRPERALPGARTDERSGTPLPPAVRPQPGAVLGVRPGHAALHRGQRCRGAPAGTR
ncbi:hypothetical protein G6F40_014988 [Rhizopus arrhizus]|nr:hypothetical protein G6F40_014988 [Rhizopus arrhizus]